MDAINLSLLLKKNLNHWRLDFFFLLLKICNFIVRILPTYFYRRTCKLKLTTHFDKTGKKVQTWRIPISLNHIYSSAHNKTKRVLYIIQIKLLWLDLIVLYQYHFSINKDQWVHIRKKKTQIFYHLHSIKCFKKNKLFL